MAPKSVTFRRHDHLVSVLFGDLLSHSYNITFSMFFDLVNHSFLESYEAVVSLVILQSIVLLNWPAISLFCERPDLLNLISSHCFSFLTYNRFVLVSVKKRMFLRNR